MAIAGPDDVPGGFDRAASRYDLLTSLNPGYRRHLDVAADALVDALRPEKQVHLMDLGCGTGASTLAIVRACRRRHVGASITGVDASAGMIDIARTKQWPSTVAFRLGSVDEPDTLAGPADSVHGVFAAYLFRNLAHPDETLRRIHRLLVPGGTLVIVDYSVADSPRAGRIWTIVCKTIIIPAGTVAGGNSELYRYLWRSVLAFDRVGQFTDRCRQAGFLDVRHRTVRGWQRGILHMFSMTKPGTSG